jgi:hypothetical protein
MWFCPWWPARSGFFNIEQHVVLYLICYYFPTSLSFGMDSRRVQDSHLASAEDPGVVILVSSRWPACSGFFNIEQRAACRFVPDLLLFYYQLFLLAWIAGAFRILI